MHSVSVNRADFLALATRILASGNVLRFRARGCSMFPLIRDGDILEIHPTSASSLQLGDIVLCCDANQRALVHRIIKMDKIDDQLMIATKGEALTHIDQAVPEEQILGKVVSLQRKSRIVRLDAGVQRSFLSPRDIRVVLRQALCFMTTMINHAFARSTAATAQAICLSNTSRPENN